MLTIMVSIKSKTDIITNSSTEVYMMNRANDGSLKSIKELVNAFLAKGGSTDTFDDLFEAEPYFNERATNDTYLDVQAEVENGYWSPRDLKPYKDFLDQDNKLIDWSKLDHKQRLKFAEIYGDTADMYEPLIGNGYVFKAKDPKDEKLAKILTKIETIYDPVIYSN